MDPDNAGQLFIALRSLHVVCALLSVSGFALRGYWMLTDNPLRESRPARVLPHCIDTILLGSAIGMLVIWGVWPQQLGWVSAKICALLVYIVLGMVAFRFGRTRRIRGVAFTGALLAAAYIIATAYTHSALGPFALMGW